MPKAKLGYENSSQDVLRYIERSINEIDEKVTSQKFNKFRDEAVPILDRWLSNLSQEPRTAVKVNPGRNIDVYYAEYNYLTVPGYTSYRDFVYPYTDLMEMWEKISNEIEKTNLRLILPSKLPRYMKETRRCGAYRFLVNFPELLPLFELKGTLPKLTKSNYFRETIPYTKEDSDHDKEVVMMLVTLLNL